MPWNFVIVIYISWYNCFQTYPPWPVLKSRALTGCEGGRWTVSTADKLLKEFGAQSACHCLFCCDISYFMFSLSRSFTCASADKSYVYSFRDAAAPWLYLASHNLNLSVCSATRRKDVEISLLLHCLLLLTTWQRVVWLLGNIWTIWERSCRLVGKNENCFLGGLWKDMSRDWNIKNDIT